MKEKGTKITVTRVFADKRIKLFDLFSDFVAKRIMAESGKIKTANITLCAIMKGFLLWNRKCTELLVIAGFPMMMPQTVQAYLSKLR